MALSEKRGGLVRVITDGRRRLEVHGATRGKKEVRQGPELARIFESLFLG